MRQYLNQNPKITLGVAIAVIGICLIVLIIRLWPDSAEANGVDGKRPPPQAWFYDRNTKELFPMPIHTTGPIETGSGPYNGEPAGVRAHVFACGDCSSNEQFIAWLEKPSPLEAAQPQDGVVMETDLSPLICTPGSDRWVRADGEAGKRIIATARAKCPQDAPANYCHPSPPAKEE